MLWNFLANSKSNSVNSFYSLNKKKTQKFFFFLKFKNRLKSQEKLIDFIPKSIKQFQLFISNDSILYTLVNIFILSIDLLYLSVDRFSF